MDHEVPIDDKNVYFTDTAPVSETHLACVDNANSKVLLVNLKLDFAVPTSTTSNPWGVASVSDDRVAVTLPAEKKIQFFNVYTNRLVEDYTITVSGNCRGIACLENQLLVSYVGSPNSVQMMDMEGQVVRNILRTNGDVVLKAPAFLSHCSATNTLYIADVQTNFITSVCLDTDEYSSFSVGHVLHSIGGLAVDGNDKAYVTDWVSDKVYQVDVKSKDIILKLSSRNELACPRGISFQHKEKTSQVFIAKKNTIQVFKETEMVGVTSATNLHGSAEQLRSDQDDTQDNRSNYWPDLKLQELDLTGTCGEQYKADQVYHYWPNLSLQELVC